MDHESTDTKWNDLQNEITSKQLLICWVCQSDKIQEACINKNL